MKTTFAAPPISVLARRSAAVFLGLEAALAAAIAFLADHQSDAPRSEAAQLIGFGAFMIFVFAGVTGAMELWRGHRVGVFISALCFAVVGLLTFGTALLPSGDRAGLVPAALNWAALVVVVRASRTGAREENA